MATCKDCINFDVCLERGDIAPKELLDGAEQDCDFFKNKTDFVEVVRCKDCRFNVSNMEKDGYDTTDYSGTDIVCSYFMTDGMEATDFCSYGERKEGAKSEQL